MPPPLHLPECMRLLPEETTSTLRKLEWLARRRMQGTLTGKHTSPDKGVSMEFAEHRPYAPGDDPRTLDWRVIARSDRNVVRQYIEETNLRATLAVDVSGSMAYTGTHAAALDGKAMSKFAYAQYLAAALAYMFIKQGDAAGLVTFDRQPLEFIRAASRPSQVHRILEVLNHAKPGADTDAAAVLHAVAERIPRRGVVFLISDLFDDPLRIVEALHHFDFRQHELVVFHVMAEEELTFPFSGYQQFRDLEKVSPMLRIDPHAVRISYLERIGKFVRAIEGACGNLRADYVPVNTKNPLRQTLLRYLGRRMHAKRSR
ncbi:MAG: DUF58 domain-containing protein [Verrucomicrobiota bacterium]